jgi:urea carboxylase system permease
MRAELMSVSDSVHVATHPAESDAHDLASFGYSQQLHRGLGAYASFAAGFSFVSILTTVFQLFGLGYGFGGPAFFWTWPLVFTGQLLVACCFAELAARYPIAGCVYQWSRRLATGAVGWSAGWLMLIGQIVSVAAAAIALQVVLPSVWSGFQLVSDNATNAVLLGSLLIVATTIVNALGVRLMARINMVGVTCELIGVALLVVLLFTKAERGPGVVLHTDGFGAGAPYFYAFAVSALMAAYVMYGFDSAGELSEETNAPRRTAPPAIIRALVASGVGGALLLIGALMAAPSLGSDLSSGGLPYVLTSRLGSTVGRLLLIDVAIAVTVCTLGIQTAAVRMIFSMARDGVLPGSGRLARVSPRTGTPLLPVVLVGVAAIGLLVVNVGNASVFLAITAVAVVIVYLAYLLVTAPLLVARLRGRLPAADGHFTLGRWGVPVNVVAVAYGLAMAVNMAWPRAAVYGTAWYLRWFAPLCLAVVAMVGAVLYLTRDAARSDVAALPVAVAE